MDDARLDRSLVFAAELEAAARAVFESHPDPDERRAAEAVKRYATGLRVSLGRWIQGRPAHERRAAS